ncbi:MAG: hypothetical protein WA906_01545, partial [Pacificimonas sp.]
DRQQAFDFERRLKSWSRAKKEAFMQKRWDELQMLSLPPQEPQARLTAKAWSADIGASLDFARDDEIRVSAPTETTRCA